MSNIILFDSEEKNTVDEFFGNLPERPEVQEMHNEFVNLMKHDNLSCTRENMQLIDSAIAELNKFAKKADKTREIFTVPINNLKNKFQAFFKKSYIDKVNVVSARLKKEYQNIAFQISEEQRIERQKEAARVAKEQAEALRKQEEDRIKRAIELEEAGATSAAEAVMDEPDIVLPPPAPVIKPGPKLNKTIARKNINIMGIDIKRLVLWNLEREKSGDHIPWDELLNVNQKAIRERAAKHVRSEIGGCIIRWEGYE